MPMDRCEVIGDLDRWIDEGEIAARVRLRSWVEINSYSKNLAGLEQMAQKLLSDFAPLKLEEKRQGDRCHLFGEFGDRTRPCVALVGHFDTVFPPGHFEGYREESGKAYGPGVLDMKGGILVIYQALHALLHFGLLDRVHIKVLLVSDEEIGSPTGQIVLEKELKNCALALVFESGRQGDKIITRRKGTGSFFVCAHGKAAHSGNNHAQGVNAIWAVAQAVDFVQRCTNYDKGLTLSAGLIHGGTSKNTVPDYAEAEIDIRYLDISDGNDFSRKCDQHFRAIESGLPGSLLELKGGLLRPPMKKLESVAIPLELLKKSQREVGLGDEESPLVGGGSDANNLTEINVPALDGLGPRGFGFHTKDEMIELSTLPLKTKSLIRLLLDFFHKSTE